MPAPEQANRTSPTTPKSPATGKPSVAFVFTDDSQFVPCTRRWRVTDYGNKEVTAKEFMRSGAAAPGAATAQPTA